MGQQHTSSWDGLASFRNQKDDDQVVFNKCQREKCNETRLQNISKRFAGLKEGSEFVLFPFSGKKGNKKDICFLCKITNLPMEVSRVVELEILASSCECDRLPYLTIQDFCGEIIMTPSSPEYEKCKERIFSYQIRLTEAKLH